MAHTSKLFQPIKVGNITLQHRAFLAPMTRLRTAPDASVVSSLVKEYYGQRASTPGTLLITEGTVIAAKAAGFPGVPGIYTPEHIAAWKEVVDAVHEKKSFIFSQIAGMGRVVFDPSIEAKGAGDIPMAGGPKPIPLTKEEIKEYVGWFATAASNAVDKAGFDGIELHGANGFILDQFLQDEAVSNNRTDEYGGSIENRARFVLEVVDAVAKAVGAEKVGLRLSPWSTSQSMRMKEPKPTYTYLVTKLRELHPNLAYIHVIEPRVDGIDSRESVPEDENNDFLREIWAPRPFLSAGGYTPELAIKVADEKGDIVGFGRHFLSSPDLPLRLKSGIALNAYDRSTFYTHEAKGYTDYPFATAVTA